MTLESLSVLISPEEMFTYLYVQSMHVYPFARQDKSSWAYILTLWINLFQV